MSVWDYLKTIGTKAVKRKPAPTTITRRESVIVAAAPPTPQPAAVAEPAPTKSDCQHEWQEGGGWKRCAKCGFDGIDRRVTTPVVVAGRGVDGKPVLREIFPDGSQVEAGSGNDTRSLLERWTRRRG